ncbi:SMP-30/gluconolactonase/LRE family protein [Actinokineospora sp. NBRC 105648]|uniref:SMP-30/gluconolactonase/LRE family protein n=1 Tax=Actinokineospora sp. NBRC 105648 TaxID=3032206 RepID=UPI0024A3AD3E|nr:SMP-30/gluconolactonase/LRE family protein [Actinokineospora sp. NBRC 105648]GLZ36377.1 hypothetical protein Acsp05_00020 [Actinokineospora sp. NBRC 105648]
MARIRPRELAAGACAGLIGRRVDGLRWTGTELSWVDGPGARIQLGRMTPLGPRHTATLCLDGRVTSAVPARDGWAVTGDPVLLRRDGRARPLALPAADGAWCDPAGRLWLAGRDTLHRVDLSGTVHPVLGGPTHALAWSPDTATVYRVGADGLTAHAFDLANGTVGAGRVLTSTARGVAVDVDGFAWVAGGSGVRRIDGAGAAHSIVRLPDAVACCFAGETMLITTADGTVHACDPGVRGLPAVRWAGVPTP